MFGKYQVLFTLPFRDDKSTRRILACDLDMVSSENSFQLLTPHHLCAVRDFGLSHYNRSPSLPPTDRTESRCRHLTVEVRLLPSCRIDRKPKASYSSFASLKKPTNHYSHYISWHFRTEMSVQRPLQVVVANIACGQHRWCSSPVHDSVQTRRALRLTHVLAINLLRLSY